jgi:hypothetical protein
MERLYESSSSVSSMGFFCFFFFFVLGLSSSSSTLFLRLLAFLFFTLVVSCTPDNLAVHETQQSNLLLNRTTNHKCNHPECYRLDFALLPMLGYVVVNLNHRVTDFESVCRTSTHNNIYKLIKNISVLSVSCLFSIL